MPYLHDAQLANIVTSYCTCLGGIIPLIFCALAGAHPPRWLFAYSCVLITGIPTVWHHSIEASELATFCDVGTNLLLVWAVQVAASGDFMQGNNRKALLNVTTGINLAALAWMLVEILSKSKVPWLRFGAFGHFNFGEVALILNAWIVVGIFVYFRSQIPVQARRTLVVTCAIFVLGMFLATAKGDQIHAYIFPWHAIWHIAGLWGFLTLWLFNHIRFIQVPLQEAAKAVASTHPPMTQ